MSSSANSLEWARKVQAIAQNGLAFTRDEFDRERFQQLQGLVSQILTSELNITSGQLAGIWQGEEGYATPKVDVRGGVFQQDRVLMVREESRPLNSESQRIAGCGGCRCRAIWAESPCHRKASTTRYESP